MKLTNIYADLHKKVTGYILNAALDSHCQEIIQHLQQKFSGEFADAVYSIDRDSLHITLMDWVAPLVDYKVNKGALFNSLFPHYDTVFREIIKEVGPIHVTFDTIGVSSGARFSSRYKTATDNYPCLDHTVHTSDRYKTYRSVCFNAFCEVYSECRRISFGARGSDTNVAVRCGKNV